MLLEVRRRALQSQGAIQYRAVNPTKPLLYNPVIPYFTNNEDTYSEKRIVAQGNPLPTPPPQGSSSNDPFVADFTGATATVSLPLYTFGDSLDYDVQSGTVYVRLDNIPTGSDNPGGTVLTQIQNIVIEFSAAPNIQSGTFTGPVAPSAEGVYLVNSWQYVFGTGTPIAGFEGVPFSFQMASTSPNIVAIYVDLIV